MNEPRGVTISKALPTVGEVQPVLIRIEAEMPDCINEYKGHHRDWMKAHDEFYTAEAVKIVDAMQQSLPQATLDRILVELCGRTASLYRVPFGRNPPE